MNKTYSLFIDTTQNYCNLAIVLNKKTIVKKISVLTHNNMTDVVVKKIKSLLKSAKVNKKDINNIYLLIGPGSFTGCKVGFIIAQAFASVLDCKIYIMNSLLFQLPKGTGISLIDTKNNKFFIGVYDNFIQKVKPQLITGNDLPKFKKKFPKYKTYLDYKSIDVFKILINSIDQFKLLTKNIKDVPLYIKGFTN